MNIKRWLSWGLVACLLVVSLALGLRPQATLVEVSQVVSAPLRVTIDEEGRTRVKDRYLVSAPVAGFVRRVEWDVGDQLQPSDNITVLEPLRSDVLDPRRRAEAEARVAAARSALLSAEQNAAAAQADADYAQAEYQRKASLAKTRAISEEELAQARTASQRAKAVLRSARFSVEVSRYELDAASTLLQYSAAQDSAGVLKEQVEIKAPVAGSVLKIFRESEGVVGAGAPILEIGDPAALEVAVDVLSFDAVQLRAGMPVELQRWGGGILQGVVRLVEPVGFTEVSALGVEEQRVWVIVDITSPKTEWLHLGDGYRVEASFVLWQQDAVLQIPNSALFRLKDGWAVYQVVDDIVRQIPVEIGRRNGLTAQLLSGLQAGDLVVRHPDKQLKDGGRVKQRN